MYTAHITCYINYLCPDYKPHKTAIYRKYFLVHILLVVTEIGLKEIVKILKGEPAHLNLKLKTCPFTWPQTSC